MTIEIPNIEAIEDISPAEIRLELACALYERGRIGKVAGADLAGIDFFSFQRALGNRGIVTYSNEMLEEDLMTLKTIFPQDKWTSYESLFLKS